MTTSATVSSNVNCTSLTEARMVSVRSEMIPTLIAGGIEACEHRQHRLDPLDRLDDVGAGLALDRQDDRALLVVPAGDQIVLRPVDGLADVAYPHRRAVAVGDDQVGRSRRA